MRNVQNQNKRMRGRNNNNNNNRKSHNPLTRVYESNGPDVKIRGTASHIAEKYIQLARDAQASGDPVGAENYYQHAEHYFRLIAAAQEQMRQNQPQQYGQQRQENFSGNDSRDGSFEDETEEEGSSSEGEQQPAFGTRDPQPFIPREANFYGQGGGDQPRQVPVPNGVDSLPSFITGTQPQATENGQGAFENGDGGGQQRFQGERHERQGFRRRRRHRGGYRSNEGHSQAAAQDDGGDAAN
jgi:hypothetical protein